MSNRSETGHVKNVANFIKFNQFVASLGAKYNPAEPEMALTALVNTQTGAATKVDTAETAELTWRAVTNSREIEYDQLDTFVSRLGGFLKSKNLPKQSLDDILYWIGKIKGLSKTKKTALATDAAVAANAGEPVVTRSGSQQSFDQKATHFGKIVKILLDLPGYTSNEPEFQLPALQTRLANLLALNVSVAAAEVALKNARIDRNHFLYAENTGVLALIKKVKAYISSLFGKASPQYDAITSIRFTKMVRKNRVV